MLIAILLVFLLRFILGNLEKKFYKELSLSKNIDESIYVRKKIKTERWFILALILILYYTFEFILYLFIFGEQDLLFWTQEVLGSLLMIAYMVIVLRSSSKNKNPLSNISLLRKEDILNRKEDYILFLRGFSKDNYEISALLDIKKSFESFSEYLLNKVIKQYNCQIGFYAVGMSKEVEAANGADRVYLNDCSWKEDVAELMQKAKAIFILMDDRESCIWEIMQTQHLSNKVIFLCDDIRIYNNVKETLKKNCSPVLDLFPELPNNNYFYFTNFNSNIVEYDNTTESYKMIIENEIGEIGINKNKKISIWLKVLLALGLIPNNILSVMFYEYLCSRINETLATICGFVFSSIYLIFICLLYIRKRKKGYFLYNDYKNISIEDYQGITSCTLKQGWNVMPSLTKIITAVYFLASISYISFIMMYRIHFSSITILEWDTILLVVFIFILLERVSLVRLKKVSYYILGVLMIVSVVFPSNGIFLFYLPLVISYFPYFKIMGKKSSISQYKRMSTHDYIILSVLMVSMFTLLFLIPNYYGNKYGTKNDLVSKRLGSINYIYAESELKNDIAYFSYYSMEDLADDYADKYEFGDYFEYDIEKAIYWYEKALETEMLKNNRFEYSLAEDLASLYESKGDYHKALSYYEQIIEYYPHYLSNGWISGIVKSAFDSINSILEKNPELQVTYKMPVLDKNKISHTD